MEPVTIELAEAPLFFIPGILHLTLENPGPIEFDPASLTQEQKTWINNAHYQRKVKVVNPNGPVKTETAPAPAAPADQKAIMQQNRDSEIEKIKELLKSPLPVLRKNLSDSDDLKLLRLVKGVEEGKKKPRKSLLKVVNERIARMNNIVAKRIGGQDVGDKLNPVQVPRENTDIVELLDDIEERDIVIRPAREEDYADSEPQVTEE